MEIDARPLGAVFSVALLIAILGNYLSWSLRVAEILQYAAIRRTVVLQPLSIERLIGINLAAGVSNLTLGQRGRQ